MDDKSDIEEALERDPVGYSAMLAGNEMHYGRIEWLAEHIRFSNYQISPIVARKLLSLIEGGLEGNLLYEMKLVRRSDLPPRSQDTQLTEIRNFQLAQEVHALGGFERGKLSTACHQVAVNHGLKESTVKRLVTSYRQKAIDSAEEERIRTDYEQGNCDFLGRPKNRQTGFADGQKDA